MSAQQQLELAKTLPPRLLRFFQKFPPPSVLQSVSVNPSTIDATTSTRTPDATPTTADPNALPNGTEVVAPKATLSSAYPRNLPPAAIAHAQSIPYHNPFLPRKSHTTGKWHSPLYGLRQQADFVKLASKYGVADLLPWTVKKPGEKEARRIAEGLRTKGTGEGDRVKGKTWERTMSTRLEMRRKAMLDMPRLVQEWKQKGHGRGWKKWPSGKPKK